MKERRISGLSVDRSLHENKIHGNPMFSFETYRMLNSTGHLFITSHWHEEIEILCFQEGQASVMIGNQLQVAGAGDIVIVNQEELHQISSISEGALYHALLFPMHFLEFSNHDIVQSQFLTPLTDKKLVFPSYLSHEKTETQLVYAELMDIIQAYEERMTGYQLRIKASLLKIISLLLPDSKEHNGDLEKSGKIIGSEQTRREILAYIWEHYSSKIFLEDIADKFHMSGKYFSQYFKTHFGYGFIEYLNFYRIEKACGLLTGTDLSIMEVGFSTGFDNFSYFIRKFKEITGVTPAAFRKEQQAYSITSESSS